MKITKSVVLAFIMFCCAGDLYAGEAVPKAAGTATAGQAAKSTAPAAGAAEDRYKDMVLVPPGEFLMGSDEENSPNEQPRHKVFLGAYFIDKYEVTVAKYKLFAKATGRQMPRHPFPGKDNYPVVYLSWHDATAYCGQYGKSLPTEAQWEKAAGGGSSGKFCFGDDPAGLGEYAWHWGNSDKKIHPVGLKKPNAYGLYDMHGNVQEWTADWYDADYYAESPVGDPQGPSQGKEKVIRGGSAFVSAALCRSSTRMRSSPDTPYSGKGFRCAAPVPQK